MRWSVETKLSEFLDSPCGKNGVKADIRLRGNIGSVVVTKDEVSEFIPES